MVRNIEEMSETQRHRGRGAVVLIEKREARTRKIGGMLFLLIVVVFGWRAFVGYSSGLLFFRYGCVRVLRRVLF